MFDQRIRTKGQIPDDRETNMIEKHARALKLLLIEGRSPIESFRIYRCIFLSFVAFGSLFF